jgi:2-dehydro-3-deoxyphosphogluconate aldolase/(4S)-4-hydroxy-2-oxoglutarate aldolase
MNAYSMLQRILESGIICAVGIGIHTSRQAKEVILALMKGGMSCFELMKGVPNANELLVELKKDYPDLILGIGTVLDTEMGYIAIQSKADFLVSPYTNNKLIKLCKRYGVVSCFGALTPKEIMEGWENGLDLVKVFPTIAMGGPEYIRILSGPFSSMHLVGAGGVTLDSLAAYFEAGASLVAVDEDLIEPNRIQSGEYKHISRRAEEYRQAIDKIRN